VGVGGQPHASADRGVSHVTVHRHVQCEVTMLATVFSAVVYYLTLTISSSPPDYTPTSSLCTQFIRTSTSLFPFIMFFNVFSCPSCNFFYFLGGSVGMKRTGRNSR